MTVHVLLVLHIVVLGYWLGSEFVINQTYRYVTLARDMDLAQRGHLMDHVMTVDQHVRYALILQLMLGFSLAALMGYLPGGGSMAAGAVALGLAWLVLVEWTHRRRKTPLGHQLARWDRVLRYMMMLALLALGVAVLSGSLSMPAWLGWKLLCFAGVMACGVGIRLVLLALPPLWQSMAREGSSEAHERALRQIYRRATSVLVLLWVFIGSIVWLSVVKPV